LPAIQENVVQNQNPAKDTSLSDAVEVTLRRAHPGTVRVELVVEVRNTKGLAFYGRHGFVVVGRIEEEGSSALSMQMVLKA